MTISNRCSFGVRSAPPRPAERGGTFRLPRASYRLFTKAEIVAVSVFKAEVCLWLETRGLTTQAATSQGMCMSEQAK